MRTLTPTLEAAQKSDTRVPYVEAKLYDEEVPGAKAGLFRYSISTSATRTNEAM